MGEISSKIMTELQQLSELVCRARETPLPSGANEVLAKIVPPGQHPLGLLGALWAGDSLSLEMRFGEAIEQFEQLLPPPPQRKSKGVPIALCAARGAAACHLAVGQNEQALKRLCEAAEAHPASEAVGELLLTAGEIAEKECQTDLASKLYEQAGNSRARPGHGGFSVKELATRARRRMTPSAPKHFEANADRLALRLAELLASRNSAALAELASPTHFTLGFAGSERHFVDFALIADEFRADLAQSDLHSDSIATSGGGGKLYMATEHWQGSTFVGRVYFVLTRCSLGWEWSGLACTGLPERLIEKLGCFEEETNQPLAISIRAPWPAGRSFRAGGLTAWAIQQAVLGLPFGLGLLIIVGLSANPAGWGPSGFYYNQGSTHRGSDAFAIDFTAYHPGLPYVDAAGGTPVLAAAAGLVIAVVSDRVSGDPIMDNRVVIAHGTTADETRRAISDLLAGRPIMGARYNSRSLHLAGPRRVFASVGMFVRQGWRLGLMDDTGNSALNHLHFAMGDRDSSSGTFASVRPTPMSGQTLADFEDGKVIRSDNI